MDDIVGALVSSMEAALGSVVRWALAGQDFWQPRKELVIERPGHFSFREVAGIGRGAGSMVTRIAVYRKPEILDLLSASGQPAAAREIVVGDARADDAALRTCLLDHLALVCGKYFDLRPTQRRSSPALVQQLAEEYGQYLTFRRSEATVVLPITGLEGSVRTVGLGRGITLRRLARHEMRELYARHQDEHALSGWFTRSSLSWQYCLTLQASGPGRRPPTPNYEEAGLAMAALRLATNAGLGLSIALLSPGRGTFLEHGRRVMIIDTPGDPRTHRLTLAEARDAARLLSALRLQPPTDPFRLAVNRYNSAMTREWVVDQLIDAWIALEATYASSEHSSSYRIALRAARTLDRSSAERRRTFDALRESYQARNRVVHGEATVPRLREHTNVAVQAVRRSLYKWAAAGQPNAATLDRSAEDGSLR